MFPPEMDRLLTLAEIAVAMAGFSAIVVLFRRRTSGTWLAADADRFNGMIVHSVSATALCLVPAIIGVFTTDPAQVWRIASSVLGLQVLLHAGIVVFYLASTGLAGSILVATGGSTVVALQVLNVTGIGFSAEPGPYLLGVCWHLIQAGGLFTRLVWVGEASIER